MDFDFCQVLYTAIDEIYSFRLRQEKILLLTQEISENSTIEVPGRPALKSTAPFQEEPITLVMARPARSSTIIKPGFKAAVALESYTASVLREPLFWGLVLPFGFGLCRIMPRPCIGVRSPGILLRLLQRATLSARSFNLTGSSIRMHVTTTCISCTKGSRPASLGSW